MILKQGADPIRNRITEHGILILSVVKWVLLAIVIGTIAGAGGALFLRLLGWSVEETGRYSWYFLLMPPVFMVSAQLIHRLAPDAEGHGTEKVIEAVNKSSGRIDAAVVPVKALTTVMTIAAGGSVGKEGPCAQIGAGLASVFASVFRFGDTDRRKLVVCGVSAGFSSVFGTPIGGAVFGIEVLAIGSLSYDVLLPSLIAGVVGFQVASKLGVEYLYHFYDSPLPFDALMFAKVILAGVFFGLCSIILIEVSRLGEHLSERMGLRRSWRPLAGGLLLVGMALLFSTRYLGMGLDSIEGALNGEDQPAAAFLLKAVFTSVTLAFGGSGGIVTPIFFIGSSAGALFAQVLGMDVALFAAIGLVGVLAGAANTPLAAGIIAIELFGPSVAPYAIVACAVSYLVTGHRSVFPAQRMATGKSASIRVELDADVQHARPRFRYRERSLPGVAHALVRAARRKRSG
ncbi:MAG: chloride channel protein [Pseudomonadota bacterium]